MENKSGLIFTISGKEIPVSRPIPIVDNIDVVPFDRSMNPCEAVDALVEGYSLLIVDFYSSGLSVLNELKNYTKKLHSGQSFKNQRDFRSVFRTLSNQILIEVSNNKLAIKKAPEIGWLKELYPDISEFLLPFPQVQGLNSSWQWYKKGIFIPVLNKKIHPYFGTYFPTRFEHLELFEKWLNKYQGDKESAIDIGIGSGILTFQMLKHQLKKVYGTDLNPNAILGVNKELESGEESFNVDLKYGDLFVGCNTRLELIVFNPPWLPASHDIEGIDKAIYYDKKLFPRFFSEAIKNLKDDGKVVILFSNLAQITGITIAHPIEEELAKNSRFTKEVFIQKSVSKASKKTRRNQNWRSTEKVELWVLKKR